MLRVFFLIFIPGGDRGGLAGGFPRHAQRRSRRIEIFLDMVRKPRYDPQHESDFYADTRAARAPVPGRCRWATPCRMRFSRPGRTTTSWTRQPSGVHERAGLLQHRADRRRLWRRHSAEGEPGAAGARAGAVQYQLRGLPRAGRAGERDHLAVSGWWASRISRTRASGRCRTGRFSTPSPGARTRWARTGRISRSRTGGRSSPTSARWSAADGATINDVPADQRAHNWSSSSQMSEHAPAPTETRGFQFRRRGHLVCSCSPGLGAIGLLVSVIGAFVEHAAVRLFLAGGVHLFLHARAWERSSGCWCIMRPMRSGRWWCGGCWRTWRCWCRWRCCFSSRRCCARAISGAGGTSRSGVGFDAGQEAVVPEPRLFPPAVR